MVILAIMTIVGLVVVLPTAFVDNRAMLTIEYAVTMTERTEAGIAELKAQLSDFVNRVIYRREVVYVTKNSRRVAALVPIEIAERYEAEQAAARERD